MNSIYQLKQVKDGVYQILESGLDAMYLICGSERSILIDTGAGTGDLKSVIGKVTDTPVDVYLTHGHRDHFGGATQFPQVYLSPRDLGLAGTVDVDSRKEYVRKMVDAGAVDESVLQAMTVLDWGMGPQILPVRDGDRIEAGDRTLVCMEAPGHTDGSVIYYDEKNNIIFSGDAANPIMVLRKSGDMDYKTYIHNWIGRIKEVNEMIDDETCICAGHGIIPREAWYQLIETAERYLEGKLLPERRKIHFYDNLFLINGNVSIMLG